MNNTSLVLLVAFYVLSTGKLINTACTISTNKDISNPEPLILQLEQQSRNYTFLMPTAGSDVINIPHGKNVYLDCGSKSFRINGVDVGVQSANITCSRGNIFKVLNRNEYFSSFSCSQYPPYSSEYTGLVYRKRYHKFEIGYKVGYNFIRLIKGLFDKYLQTTVYSSMELDRNMAGCRTNFPRPSWTGEEFYNLQGTTIKTLYSRSEQRITINNLLGLRRDSMKYVHKSDSFYLTRGHLSAKCDFVLGTQQRATFSYINAAPQWQVINQANWRTLENDIRDQVKKRNKNLLIYTGTYGISTLPHEQTGNEVSLFLYIDQHNNGAIPVPQLFWKIVYEPISKVGVVLLTLNNPYLSSSSASNQIICPDVCHRITWLNWNATDITKGYSYCCTVGSFRRVTNFLPYFDDGGLLK